jgi:hypothetical protein
MAKTSFYDDNKARDYPLLKGESFAPFSAVVAAGFTFGPGSGFVAGEHNVFFTKVLRAHGRFWFFFTSDAPGIVDKFLVFSRSESDKQYAIEYADLLEEDESVNSISESFVSNPAEGCDFADLFSGFLITGPLDELLEALAEDEYLYGPATVEPALLQSLVNSYGRSINLANSGRTLYTPPTGCESSESSSQSMYVKTTCITGPIVFSPGYNSIVIQNKFDKSITFSAAVGAGDGEPCEQIPIYEGEAPPTGSQFLEGGPSCAEVIRSVGGVGGPILQIVGGQGATVGFDSGNHIVSLSLDLHNMLSCGQELLTADTANDECVHYIPPDTDPDVTKHKNPRFMNPDFSVNGVGVFYSIIAATSGSLVNRAMTLAGVGAFGIPLSGSGALSTSAMRSSGSGTSFPHPTGSGDLAPPIMTISGAGTVSLGGDGPLTPSALTSAGVGTFTPGGTGGLAMAAMTASGAGVTGAGTVGSGALSPSAMTSSGVGHNTPLFTGSGTLHIRSPGVSIEDTNISPGYALYVGRGGTTSTTDDDLGNNGLTNGENSYVLLNGLTCFARGGCGSIPYGGFVAGRGGQIDYPAVGTIRFKGGNASPVLPDSSGSHIDRLHYGRGGGQSGVGLELHGQTFNGLQKDGDSGTSPNLGGHNDPELWPYQAGYGGDGDSRPGGAPPIPSEPPDYSMYPLAPGGGGGGVTASDSRIMNGAPGQINITENFFQDYHIGSSLYIITGHDTFVPQPEALLITIECWGGGGMGNNLTGGGGGGYSYSVIDTRHNMVTEIFNDFGSHVWRAPANLLNDTVLVECWGSGAGGFHSHNTSDASSPNGFEQGPGGGGGAYARKTGIIVTPNTNYDLFVGKGGDSDEAGEGSWFIDDDTIFATGGRPHSGDGHIGSGGGRIDNCIGDVVFKGGNGGNIDNSWYTSINGPIYSGWAGSGAGGGSSAGWLTNGLPGENNQDGTSGGGGLGGEAPVPGGNGGNGSNVFGFGSGYAGSPGQAPGGGGGGAATHGTPGHFASGGSGANGRVQISYLFEIPS